MAGDARDAAAPPWLSMNHEEGPVEPRDSALRRCCRLAERPGRSRQNGGVGPLRHRLDGDAGGFAFQVRPLSWSGGHINTHGKTIRRSELNNDEFAR